MFEKILEIYDTVRTLHTKATTADLIPSSDHVFHFSDGDISDGNVLIDPATEAAGFRPARLAALDVLRFNDDERRFVMSRWQDAPEGYEDETQEDADLRRDFHARIGARSPEMLWHLQNGAELRCIFNGLSEHVPSAVSTWLEKYQKYGWDEGERGPFPFPMDAWIMECLTLYKTCVHRSQNRMLLIALPISKLAQQVRKSK